MRPEVREALEASIEKWRRNAEVEDCAAAEIFSDSCPLCVLFSKTLNGFVEEWLDQEVDPDDFADV